MARQIKRPRGDHHTMAFETDPEMDAICGPVPVRPAGWPPPEPEATPPPAVPEPGIPAPIRRLLRLAVGIELVHFLSDDDG